MRIHRIALRNYRGVDEIDVELPASGVAVIEGPNEVGKSSLIEALHLLFDYRDNSVDKRVRSVTPTHGGASPQATVELSTGPYRVTYGKTWHRKHGTTSLTISEPAHEQVHGRAAHERMEAILAETLDRPLWDALRLEQGANLDDGGFAGARSLSRALDLAAGGRAEVDDADGLWDRIEAERDRYWYATGKPRAEGVALARAVTHASAEVDQVTSELAALDRLSEEADALDASAGAIHEQVETTQEQVADLTKREAAATLARAEMQAAEDSLAAARAEEARAQAQQRQRTELTNRAAAAVAAVAAAEASLAAAAPRQAAADEAHRAATEAVNDAHRELAAAEAAHRLAVDDQDHARQQIEVAQLAERLQAVTEARAEITAAQDLLATNRVTDEELAALEDAHLAVVRATGAAEVSATIIDATALAPIDVIVDGHPIALAADQRRQLTVAGETEVIVPGIARFMVRAGVEATACADRLRAAENDLRGRCESLGVADLAAARTAAATRAAAVTAAAQAETALAQNRRDLTDEALARKVERVRNRIAAYRASRPAVPAPPPDLTAAQAHATETQAGVARARQWADRCDAAHRRSDRAQRDGELAASTLTTRLDAARRTAELEGESLARARADASDETLALAVHHGSQAQAAAEQVLGAARAALRQIDPEATASALALARRAEAEARQADQRHRSRRDELRIQLEVRGEQGLSERADAAATSHQRAHTAHESWERRAVAARHLHTVFAARRQQVRRRYEAPLAERIQELGRLVFGPSLHVDLDADLAIATRTLDGTTVAFDQLSTGAREQLGVLSRLACATLVDPHDGVPVVLDDVLGWSDPTRLIDVAAAIDEAGRQAQVIVLTCTPSRFEALEDATVLHLGPAPTTTESAVDGRRPSPALSGPGVTGDADAAGGEGGAATRRPRRGPRRPADEAPTLFSVEERPAI